MKTYHGKRHNESEVSVWIEEDGTTRALEHHVRHSPSGFNWGYAGSGPSELARCLIMDAFGADPQPAVYMKFKDEVIAPLEDDEWSMTELDIRQAVVRLEEPEPEPLDEREKALIRQMIRKEMQAVNQMAEREMTQEEAMNLSEYGRALNSIMQKLGA